MASSFEQNKQTFPDPTYIDRLHEVTKEPIHISGYDYSNGRTAPPTPLDPENVFISGWDTHIGRLARAPYDQNYLDFAITHSVVDVDFLVQSGILNEEAGVKIKSELVAQIVNRARHSHEAFNRLVGALAQRPADNEMLEIVGRLRAGQATLPEMVRTLKEYPEMLSVETSNYRSMLSELDAEKAIDEAWTMAYDLRDNFKDAEIAVHERNKPGTMTFSKDVQGVVAKTVMADIMSLDSHSQLVLKVPYMNLGGPMLKKMGVTTYLRTRDYTERPGYYPQHKTMPIGPEDLEYLVNHMPAPEAREILGRLAASQYVD